MVGPPAGTARLTLRQVLTAMVLAELYALGVAGTEAGRLKVAECRTELGW
jgi:hypothetical protein